MKAFKNSKSTIIVAVILLFSIVTNISLLKQLYKITQSRVVTTVIDAVTNKAVDLVEIKQALAEDLYPVFMCPCCGKLINTPCCGMAKERKTYVDGLTTGNISYDDAVASYVQRFGLSSFIDKEKQETYRQELIKTAPADRPIISIEPAIFDFGQVSFAGGVVTSSFEVTNIGATDLVIDHLETSCGCTSASIVYQNQEGPIFAMPGHGINEAITDWSVNIQPGETAQLKVYYDPNVHPEFRGNAVREIHVYSNDPIDFESSVTVELEQVD